MITIIHGDDTATSRKVLTDIRLKTPEVLSAEGESLTVTDLAQMVQGGGLFVTQKTIIIENLYAKKKATKEFAAILELLQAKTQEYDIYIWEGKELDKKSLSLFKHAVIKTYKLPQTLFIFLDSIKPNQGKHLVTLHHKVLQTTEEEMVFLLLVRQVRLLLALKEKSDEQIDEVKRLALWQLNKIQKQASLFTIEELVNLHTRLYALDKAHKTGELVLSLTVALDILLIDI